MNCYFIKKPSDEELKGRNYLVEEERSEVAKNVFNIAKTAPSKNNIFIYSDEGLVNYDMAFASASYINSRIGFVENNIMLDGRLNQTNLYPCSKKESKKDLNNRLFDFVAELAMTYGEQDYVFVFASEDIFSAMQKEPDIHSMMYFGDEYLVDKKDVFGLCHPLGIPSDILREFELMAHTNARTLESKVKPKTYIPHPIVIEKPKYDKLTGNFEPVYETYAKKKLKEYQQNTNPSQMGE